MQISPINNIFLKGNNSTYQSKSNTKENIKKYSNLALFPIFATGTSIMGIKSCKNIPKSKVIISSVLFAGISTALLTLWDNLISGIIKLSEKTMNGTHNNHTKL